MKKPISKNHNLATETPQTYDSVLSGLVDLLESARHASIRAINTIMTATYWEIGRRIVEFEQRGASKADYGQQLLKRIATDLASRFGRGFSVDNLQRMRAFYLGWPVDRIYATLSRKSGQIQKKLPEPFALQDIAQAFPLPWSYYVRLLSIKNLEVRQFYEAEALRGGWSVRQLDRQVSSLFYERTLLSKNKAAMLKKAASVVYLTILYSNP